jgi:hypothetical protein
MRSGLPSLYRSMKNILKDSFALYVKGSVYRLDYVIGTC